VRRPLIALAVLVLLGGGIVAALVIHRLQQAKDIRGSSTEFTLTTTPQKPPSAAAKVPWPTYGFDATRTRSVDLALSPPFRTSWRYHAGSLVEFPPSIGYGRLYFSTNAGRFAAISAKTGKRAWKLDLHRCVAASPAIGPHAHGTVYAVFLNHPPCNALSGGHGNDGLVVALSAGHGKVHWKHTIGPSESSPLLLDGRLYVADWNGDVWAFDADNGRVLWRRHVGGALKGAVASAGGKLYIGSYDGHLYSLTLAGKVVWRASSQPRLGGHGRFYSTPALAYGRVYIGSTDGKVYSYGATSGRLIWSHSTGGYVYASPAVWNDRVLAGSYGGWFSAFDAATGETRWRFHAGGKISGSATVIGDIVYFATLNGGKRRAEGRTYALNARTGKLVWSFPDGKYTPVVAEHGRLFLIGYGTVYGMVPR
jgi:outer membrane protein assembly factor BamB